MPAPSEDNPQVVAELPSPQPALGNAPPSTSSLWLEVSAVLAVSVFPWLWDAIELRLHTTEPRPYWLDSLSLFAHSACKIFVVLYLIHRSGEKWKVFGLVRPGLGDLVMGVVLFVADYWMWVLLRPMLPDEVEIRDPISSRLGGGLDYGLLVLKHLANGFAEELILRAYLITRLERLLESRTQAVLLSALAFASYHLYYGPGGALLYIFFMGLFFGGSYLLVRRVWGFALAHALINIFIDLASASGSVQ